MELCTAARGAIFRLPQNGLFTPNQTTILSWKTSLRLKHSSISRINLEETSSGVSQYVKEETDGVTTMEDVQTFEKNEPGETEGAKEEPSVDDQMQSFEFLDKLNIELDSETPYSVLLLGSGSLAALWFATAVVGAIDSIPFPELMKAVGLAYSLRFSTRYLLFKKNRDELTAKIEEIKQQVLGSNDD